MNEQKKGPIKVLLADDHHLIRTGFSTSLTSFGIEVIGSAKTPDEAVQMYAELLPDVLVLDIRFGERMTGLDAAKQILEKHPDANIVFLSQFDQDSLIKETYRLGGRAFVTKDSNPESIALAVTTAHAGELYFLPNIATRLANLSVRGDDSPRSQLEPRELEIFVLMAKGLTNSEMAEKLVLSPKTISNVSHTIKGKLGMHRAADLTRLALKHGFIDP